MTTCNRCGAEIVWTKTLAGKNMPLDKRPDERYGSFLLLEGRAIHQARASDEEKFLHGYSRYQSHYDTCANPKYPSTQEALP